MYSPLLLPPKIEADDTTPHSAIANESRGSVNVTHPRDPVLAEWISGRAGTYSGVTITHETAMRIMAVYACVRIISESIASLPTEVFRLTEDGREHDRGHRLTDLLGSQPNPDQTAYEFWEMVSAHVALRGDGIAWIRRGGTGIVGIYPMRPDWVIRVYRGESGRIWYDYRPPEQTDDFGTPAGLYAGPDSEGMNSEVLHIRGLSLGGLRGLDPISYARESLGLTSAAEQFGSRFFGQGTVMTGVLQTDSTLSDQAYERLKKEWKEKRSGVANAHKTAILEDGVKWQKMGIEPEAAQFLETRKFQVAEVARLYRIPMDMLADSQGTGITNVEQRGIQFVTYTLRPWLKRIEHAIRRDLIPRQDRSQITVKFNVNALLRADLKSRYEAFNRAIGGPWMVPNEARGMEGLNSRDDFDLPYPPPNMTREVDDQPADEGKADE